MQEVVIIGAPRSGTNMLRDVLCSLPAIATWPCDEINYLWRHGNASYPSDEIPKERVNGRVKAKVRKSFNWVSKKYGANYVVEKTCANSLRVPFIDAIIPSAKYVFIVRDGIDATGSAKLRWTAKLDIPYILEKVRFVPKVDLPYYAGRYFWSRIYRIFSREKRLAFWGPALNNMQSVLSRHSLNEVCAIQWQQCVDKADQDFMSMPEEKYIKVRYEDFVQNPDEELRRILDFLDYKNVDVRLIESAVARVSPKSIGKGRAALDDSEVKNLEVLVGDTLKSHGYL
jgi:hypothetical protein